MRIKKLRHRPSDELIDIRERGLPWLLAVFCLLFVLLTILIIYLVFSSRDFYLAQRNLAAPNEEKRPLPDDDDDVDELSASVVDEAVNVDVRIIGLTTFSHCQFQIVPIRHRTTGVLDNETSPAPSTTPTAPSSTTHAPTTTTTTSLEILSNFEFDSDEVHWNREGPSASAPHRMSEERDEDDLGRNEEDPVDPERSRPDSNHTSFHRTSTSPQPDLTELDPVATSPDPAQDINDMDQAGPDQDIVGSAPAPTSRPETVLNGPGPAPSSPNSELTRLDVFPTLIPTRPDPERSGSESDPTRLHPTPTRFDAESDASTSIEDDEASPTPRPTGRSSAPAPTPSSMAPTTPTPSKPIEWNHTIRSRSAKFEKFAISTHHPECSRIGRKIMENGGNAIDGMIAAEFCIAAVHPHSTGPGFGAIMMVHSKKKNGTFIIDGRERAPRNANQNTFVINPTIAHIGYSSMGVPGWMSVIWTAFKQFGSGKIKWDQLLKPTIELMEKGIFMDRFLANAFESRKNHILHEKSFKKLLNATKREASRFENAEFRRFLTSLAESDDAEHDFYRGKFASRIVDEMKKRGGLISKHDLAGYSSIVTRAEQIALGAENFVAGPHLPYHFPILRKLFDDVTEKYANRAADTSAFIDDLIELMLKANRVRQFIGDELFDPEIKAKIEKWDVSDEIDREKSVDVEPKKTAILAFSRILTHDSDGNSVNFMSTNTVPFGSVRRSHSFGFVWNNAMSLFDIFCRYEINCVRGGTRPASPVFPSMILGPQKQPISLLSPTSSAIETTSTLAIRESIMKMNTSIALDLPRVYAYSPQRIFAETGIPAELHRHLWEKHRVQFQHPANPVNVVRVGGRDAIEVLCDFRESPTTCFPDGV
ncbi:unnamed protein product [Caenorhabditis bovis]|uniref:Gamma-glutamyltransferase n=1 Tax=Caenorhabditis bovis TaxID=2654633 RepID=A0A8S1EAI9_9PELO|nr:unnamed protein product [Caenorhabditis bovis]